MRMDRKTGCWLALAAVVLTPHVALAQQFAWFKYQEYEGWIEDTNTVSPVKTVGKRTARRGVTLAARLCRSKGGDKAMTDRAPTADA